MQTTCCYAAIINQTIVGVNTELYVRVSETNWVVWYGDLFGGEFGNRIPAALPKTSVDIAFPGTEYTPSTPNQGTPIPEPGTIAALWTGMVFILTLQYFVRRMGRRTR
jgi:hypothetical protein